LTAAESGLRVAYRVNKKGYAGKLINYTEHGGFVAADKLPEVGARVQMAVVGSQESKPVWLDLRVTWVNAVPRGSIRVVGFGGQWLHACSKVSSVHLLDFLSAVLGLDSPEARQRSDSGKILHLFDFPQAVAVAQQKDQSGLSHQPEDTPVEAPPVSGNTGGFTAPETFDNLPVVTDADLPESAAQLKATDDGEPLKSPDESKLVSFVKRLSSIRFRKTVIAAPVELDFTGHSRLVIFRLDKQACSAEVVNVGASWIKLQTEDAVPEVWTRINIEVPMPSSGKRMLPIEIQATVTRIKGMSVRTEDVLKGIELKGLHCKINRVNEKGQLGAFKQFIESFEDGEENSAPNLDPNSE
jgi:hypothetical protein